MRKRAKPDSLLMQATGSTHEGTRTKKSDSRWYTLSLFLELEKFLSRYSSLRTTTKKLIEEMIYFRKPDKGLYEREVGGIFVGYVFVKLKAKSLPEFQRALRSAGLAEILGYVDGEAKPLTQEEFDLINEVMKSHKQPKFAIGKAVMVRNGPYEGMEGMIVNIVGQQVNVKFQLRRSVSYADISMENLEEVA